MMVATYLIVLLAMYLLVLTVIINHRDSKIIKIIFKLNNQIMESNIKLLKKQKVSIVSVSSDGTEGKIKYSELSLISSNNPEICTVEQDGDDFFIIPVSQGKTQIIAQFKVGSDTLTESLDIVIDEDSKIVSIKFVLGDVVPK